GEQVAGGDRFRRVLYGVPAIGRRYSALSDFGMAPAAIMGLDVARFLGHAAAMAERCGASTPPAETPGVLLGITLGVLARHGRDKVAGGFPRYRRSRGVAGAAPRRVHRQGEHGADPGGPRAARRAGDVR